MTAELTNLLPEFRKRSFRRQYFVRLGTILICALILLVVLHGILLLPTYLYARSEADRAAAAVATMTASADTAGEAELKARRAALDGTAQNLTKLKDSPTASAALRAVLALPRPGVRLTGFTFTAEAPARMQVTGIAASRDALRQYAAALGELPFVTSADLPISAYAKETDIDFTVTLSGTLRP